MIKAEILADSLCPMGNRLTTLKVVMPRIVLAEFNTHRMFSRNSASSRAIPFNKMLKSVTENPFIPIAWQKDHKGMQGTEYFTDKDDTDGAISEWLEARDGAIINAKQLNKQGVTKQLCNRLLEPFMWHTVIVSATEFENFFKLRCPQYQARNYETYKSKKDFIIDNQLNVEGQKLPHVDDILGWLQLNKSAAEIHIQAVAEAIWDARNESTPKQLKAGEWHIPFGDKINESLLGMKEGNLSSKDINDYIINQKIKIATARCARLSYETLGDNPKIDYKADIALHDNLIKMEHWSPLEHIAKVITQSEYELHVNGTLKWTGGQYDKPLPTNNTEGWCRNFRGFIQYRALIDNKIKL